MTTPDARPINRTRAIVEARLDRPSARSRAHTPPMSLAPEDDRRADPGRGPAREQGDEVRQQHRGRDRQQQGKDADLRLGDDPELVREQVPPPSAGRDPQGKTY